MERVCRAVPCEAVAPATQALTPPYGPTPGSCRKTSGGVFCGGANTYYLYTATVRTADGEVTGGTPRVVLRTPGCGIHHRKRSSRATSLCTLSLYKLCFTPYVVTIVRCTAFFVSAINDDFLLRSSASYDLLMTYSSVEYFISPKFMVWSLRSIIKSIWASHSALVLRHDDVRV